MAIAFVPTIKEYNYSSLRAVLPDLPAEFREWTTGIAETERALSEKGAQVQVVPVDNLIEEFERYCQARKEAPSFDLLKKFAGAKVNGDKF